MHTIELRRKCCNNLHSPSRQQNWEFCDIYIFPFPLAVNTEISSYLLTSERTFLARDFAFCRAIVEWSWMESLKILRFSVNINVKFIVEVFRIFVFPMYEGFKIKNSQIPCNKVVGWLSRFTAKVFDWRAHKHLAFLSRPWELFSNIQFLILCGEHAWWDFRGHSTPRKIWQRS